MKKLTRILLTCALIAAMLVSYAVAMAADIGYTGSTTLSMLSDQLFNGVARKKSANGGAMSVNTQPGGSKPGWVQDSSGNPITSGNPLKFNCVRTTSTTSYACSDEYVKDNERKFANFKTNMGIKDAQYYLYIYNARWSTTNFSMTWTPN